MSTAKKQRRPLFERLRSGLEEGIRHVKGERHLRTTILPEPPPQISPAEVVALRLESEMSQATFARLLNVSTKTVQSWEQGTRKPSQAALRLIQILRANPSGVFQIAGISGP